MKICLYSPYVPKHVGGGEKYFFDVARLLSTEHRVQVAIPHFEGTPKAIQAVREKYEQFLGQSLAKIEFISTPLNTTAPWWLKIAWTRQFDVLYYLTDGSLFFSLAKRNILHIQIPFTTPKTSFSDRMKLQNWQVKNTNSAFTKKIIEKNWHTKIDVVHWPMVDVGSELKAAGLKSDHKQKVILHVGRFFRQLHSKRQDVLVNIFKELLTLYPQQTKGWKLVLVGAVEDEAYAAEVKKRSQGLPVEMYHNLNRQELLEWYAKASIYWHATGFGCDELAEPEKMEHFGISTVEAMAAGCIPIVINKGGQPEVLGESLASGLWNDESECIAKTITVIQNEASQTILKKAAREQAATFGSAQFIDTLQKMITS
ncbi:MAG TPA: glycosyltransferase family 4 protein [Vitreimonas sp.]|nr:glycosyltransferase family 4 protein [Vitreimonas sp.]